ncbi:MAG TPA: MaoC/PaaZ C-terminal domain-containing protein [Anaerolineales bacterium]|nr:MaoC/PaaZ C-terminal domain-containing protein [Anaerolineales bacterium]
MSPLPPAQRGMYFEEFQVGQRIVTAGRTVTETDIVTFAGLSGDFNQIHIDEEYSKSTPFSARVAHGLLGLSMASGLVVQTGFMEGTIMAFREVNEWKFIKPIYIGDTIHVETEVKETKAIPRIGGGSIVISLDVKNQKGETSMKGTWTALIAGRPE